MRTRVQYRELVRVQLGGRWYRCSDFALWRWHVNAERLNGRWGPAPGEPDVLDLTNDDFECRPS